MAILAYNYSLIMNVLNEQVLIDLEDKYSELLLSLGLPDGNNRFKQAFRNYKQLTREMSEAGTQIIPEKWTAKFKYAVYDLMELLDIYNALHDYPDRPVLKEKIKLLNGGVNSPADETSSNTIARNTQFELKLFSEFKAAGVRCELGNPNPDIKMPSSLVGKSYAVECKRIFSASDSSVHDNISSARDQLIELLTDNPGQTGIIALDITRRLTQGTDYLRAKNEEVAKEKLSYELDQFRINYARYFTPKKIRNKRMLAVLLHASMYTYIEDRELASHGAYTVIHEIHPEPYSKILFQNLLRDALVPLSMHKDPLNEPNIVKDTQRRF